MTGYTVTGSLPGGGPNGRPIRPYYWNDHGTAAREAEIGAQVAALRARAAAQAGLDICEAVERPGAEWQRELTDLTHPAITADTHIRPPDTHIRPPAYVPYGVNGRRRFWYVMPPALAAALAQPPPAPKTARRCRRCGYLTTRCTCRRRP
jgi:hypothetical protein